MGCPVSSGAFYAYRLVFPIWSQVSQHYKFFVVLLCTYPSYGALYTRIYDPNIGWISMTEHNNGWNMLAPTTD